MTSMQSVRAIRDLHAASCEPSYTASQRLGELRRLVLGPH